jgi:hypothetical protein
MVPGRIATGHGTLDARCRCDADLLSIRHDDRCDCVSLDRERSQRGCRTDYCVSLSAS